jgi:uncharacterized membrane protein YebE (DUF533 family)
MLAHPLVNGGSRAAMWNSMRQLRTFSQQDLQATAEVGPSRTSRYLQALIRAGYVQRLQPARGVVPASYRLVRNTGPVAPRLARDGTLHDANLADPARVPHNRHIGRHANALLKVLRELVDAVRQDGPVDEAAERAAGLLAQIDRESP